MLTAFGKIVRKLRIDHGIRLKDMANAIGVSSAFLSAVETGRKNIPDDLVSKVCNFLELPEMLREEVEKAAQISQKEIKISLSDVDNDTRLLAVAFARSFNKLDEGARNQITDILNKRSVLI